MKKQIGVLLVGIAALFGCSQEAQVVFADGQQTQLRHWDGRWLVINYWAEWCAPCRHEIPELNELHHDRVANGLVVLGVNWDGFGGEELQGMIERLDIEFPVLKEDPYQQWGYDRPQQLPMTVLISPEREVAHKLMGPQTQDTILGLIR